MVPRIPKRISERFRYIDKKNLSLIEASLRQNYFTQRYAQFYDAEYLSSDKGQSELQEHLCRRLDAFRNSVIPWLNDAKPLAGSRILEIGCGTGSSTVALAEQGAEVTAVDILETSLIVAKDRCKVYDLNVNFLCANATKVHNMLGSQHFDFIIFFATLEHMTHSERMIAMKNTWGMLSPGSLWCLIDTPNRLWYYDGHTSQLPFYLWLPDELAFLYSRFSPRKSFCNLYREIDDDSKLNFLRRGRGVSFHEFELTMKPAEELDVVSSLPIFLRNQNFLKKVLWRLKNKRSFESFLVEFGPKIHKGFYQESLDLIIRKD
ncbi:MAG: methyltransferase domain-containing protein [Candidatus Omnitrophica bacterium]|nr:methyltransferase domain-containing protein [Candidatus Omnitrophota bacterium]